MQQEGIMLLRRAGEIPTLQVQEVVVLWVYLQSLVVGQIHAFGCILPGGWLVACKTYAANEVPKSLRIGAFNGTDGTHRVAQVLARHQIGEIIIVHHRAVLVRAGHAIYAEAPPLALREKPEVVPEPSRFDQDLGAVTAEEFLVPTDLHVFSQGIGDIGVYVILRGAGRIIGRRFLAVDGPPGERGAAVAELPGARASLVQHIVAMLEKAACNLRPGVDQERDDVDFGIPEIMPLVGPSRKSTCADTVSLGTLRSLQELKQVPPDHLLRPWMLRLDCHVGAAPESTDVRSLLIQNAREALLDCATKRPAGLTLDLFCIGAVGVVVAEIFVNADGLAPLDHGLEDDRREVVIARAFGRERTVAFHPVVHAATKDKFRALRAVAQDGTRSIALPSRRVKHATDEPFSQPRVAAVHRQRLPICKLRGDHDVRIGILRGKFVLDRGQVTVRERNEADGSQMHAFAGRRCPTDVAAEYSLLKIEPAPEGKDFRLGDDERFVVDE